MKRLILMYHRVAECEEGPWPLSVTPTHFSEHLQVLQDYAVVVSLEVLQSGECDADRQVALTFDDGYADNWHSAWPLLQESAMPATFFIVTGCVGRNREFWWDELERLLLRTDVGMEVRIDIAGRTRTWRVSTKPSPWTRLSWRRADHGSLDPRQRVYHEIYQLLWPLPDAERLAALDSLASSLPQAPPPDSASRPMQMEELKALAAEELAEIGSHTVTHPPLPKLPRALQADEIIRSKAYLEESLGTPIQSFSYPYNRQSRTTRSLVERNGFARACGGRGKLVERGAAPFDLSRFAAKDWDANEFRLHLEEWMAA